MKMNGNTILVTGGGSGIGRGLAEAFHDLGNTVIIAGRRQHALDATTHGRAGMESLTLDMNDPNSIRSQGAELLRRFPSLNVVVHNAGIAKPEDLHSPAQSVADAEAMITTNLLGPIRLNAVLLPHLQKQPASVVMTVTSGLAFVPLTMTPTYCATKAALHSYTQSLRFQLKGSSTEVIELIPPYVQTELGGEQQKSDPRAMPLEQFIQEVMHILKTQPNATELVVDRCKPLRLASENGKFDEVFQQLNQAFAKH